MYGLTQRQYEFYQYLKTVEHDIRKPNNKEMAKAMGYSSISSAHRMMTIMHEKGMLSFMHGRHCAWKLN